MIKNIDKFMPTILYVEDEEGIRVGLARFFKQYTDKLYTASDGKEGLDMYKKYKPDIIVSDIKMPLMSGLEMAKAIKKIDPKQHIIFTSAHNDSSYMLEAIELNIDGYVLKPVDHDKLEYKLDAISDQFKQKHELQQYQQKLEERVKEEVDKNKEQEFMLFEQSRLAQMGEMINMIAHQWRQPLSVISAIASSLSLKSSFGTLDHSRVDQSCDKIIETTQTMSQTINDFMNFNKKDNNKQIFLHETIENVKEIIGAEFKSIGIELDVSIDQELSVYHNATHIKHTLLNILINARDALIENSIENMLINIYTIEDENSITLVINDNAGGIPKEIIDRVFEPYFTTKEDGKGTGIGLYMSKKMITSIPNSYIDVDTQEGCTLFKLKFRKSA